MAHFVRIIKERSLKKKWKEYLNEKEIAYDEDESCDEFSEESEFDEEVGTRRFTNTMKSPSSVENLLWKSAMGFIGGVLLTYLFFFFFYIGANFSLYTTTSLCGLAGVILCLGFAFSSIIGCYVLLFLPVFFSKECRQVVLTYALFLAFTGPGSNTMHNMGMLSDSMICGQDIVKKTLKQIFEMVKAPFRATKETIQKIIKALKDVIQSFKHFVMRVERLFMCTLQVINNSNMWLRSIISLCNSKMGTPFQRCTKAFDEVISDCKVKLGLIGFFCHVVHVIKGLCYSVKCLDYVCVYTEFASDKILRAVKKKLEVFNQRVKNMFYVSVEFCDRYGLETNECKAMQKVTKSAFEKIAKNVEKLQSVFSFLGFTFILLFLFLSFKVYSYKYKFLCSDQYDNVYISKYIVDLDVKRAQMDRETVLPLEPRERKKYAKYTAIRLLEIEKTRIAQSMSFLSLTSFKVPTFLVIDYSLFWVLYTIYKTGYDAVGEAEKSKLSIHVDGDGVLADFYRSLGKTFQVPESPNMHLTQIHCLPDPVRPDTSRYIQIGSLSLGDNHSSGDKVHNQIDRRRSAVNIQVSFPGFLVAVCWILTMTEAYGLRLRNVVMSHYYPDRARERAIWLYKHILRSRGSFLRYARRQLRRKYCGQFQQKERLSLTQRLFANFPLVGALCRGKRENNCLICGSPQTKTVCLKRCRTPDCEGRYCLECFATLQNVCTICQHPIEYGDVSDISEEIDSSEEDACNRKHQHNCESGESANDIFLTSKDMEVRDRFRDVESYKVPDYAKLGDLYQDKKALKKQLRAVLQRHIQNAKKVKTRRNIKQSIYKQIRLKLEGLITNLKRKKLREITLRKSEIKKKFAEKIKSLKNFRRKKREEVQNEEKQTLLEAKPKRLKSKVSFKLEPVVHEEKEVDYKTLREKVRARITRLKEKKNLGSTVSCRSIGRSSTREGHKSPTGISGDGSKENFVTSCSAERENDFVSSEGEETNRFFDEHLLERQFT